MPCWGKALKSIAKSPAKEEKMRLSREGDKIKLFVSKCE